MYLSMNECSVSAAMLKPMTKSLLLKLYKKQPS